jgi:hypothetical protein
MNNNWNKKLRMPKEWQIPVKVYKPDSSINLGSYNQNNQDLNYLIDGLIVQLFDEVDEFNEAGEVSNRLIFKNYCGKNSYEVVAYNKDSDWIVVHPSAIDIIKSLDIKFKLGIFSSRKIVRVSEDIVNVQEYWNKCHKIN